MSPTKSLLAASAAGACLSFAVAAQGGGGHGLAMTNLRELRQPTQGEHVLSGKALALHNLESVRSEMAPFAFQEQLAPSPLSVQVTNLGDMLPVVFTGHVLSPGAADGGATTILYAPSESDDPAYRAAIAAAAGGATVDYFDARVSTPSVATLTQYDAVYTWANFAYSNNVLFGDNLAAYNDQGGTVILGAFCTYTTGNFLSGQIMTSGYSPVDSPFGTNHFSNSSYVGDGSTCIYDGVTSLSCTYRDFLVTQGSGVVDGHYADNEICHAYRGTSAPGQGDVIYSNGAGAVQLGCGGQWGTAVGNGSVCSVASGGAPKILYAPSEADDPSYRAAIAAASGGTVDYFDAAAFTPRAVILQGYTAVHTWANFAYHNNVAFGDRLAAAADNGRNIVLGAFCTYTNGNFLSGQIMTSAYCPVVSPSGSNHFSNATDTGPFGTCLGDGVTSLTAFYRDILVKQGAGVVDSTYDSDGEICLAYRPNPGGGAGNVVYANGSGGFPVLGSGQWGEAVANGATCSPVSLELPQCNLRLGVLGMNPSAAGCASMPIAGQTMSVSVDATPTIGSSTAATIVAVGFGGPTSGATVFGHELLVLPPFVVSTGFGTHGLPIPSQASIVGSTFSLQGGRIEADPSAIVLTNALDITVGL
jgi:hypothetical protein